MRHKYNDRPFDARETRFRRPSPRLHSCKIARACVEYMCNIQVVRNAVDFARIEQNSRRKTQKSTSSQARPLRRLPVSQRPRQQVQQLWQRRQEQLLQLCL